MEKRKTELFPEDVKARKLNPSLGFPNVQQSRFQSVSYAAVEVTKFHSLFQELIKMVVDSKKDSGTQPRGK